MTTPKSDHAALTDFSRRNDIDSRLILSAIVEIHADSLYANKWLNQIAALA